MCQGKLTINKFKWKVLKSVYFKIDPITQSFFPNEECEDFIKGVINEIMSYYFDIDINEIRIL
jgi:hypothetical protein